MGKRLFHRHGMPFVLDPFLICLAGYRGIELHKQKQGRQVVVICASNFLIRML